MDNLKAVNLSQNLAKFKNIKSLILVVIILSAVNVILPILGIDLMFYYASFLSSSFAVTGANLALLHGNNGYAIAGTVLSILTVVPYLVSYIIAEKKKVGSMILATVFFAIDTIAMAYSFVSLITNGIVESSMIIGILLHIFILVTFIIGITYAVKVVKEEKELVAQAEANMVAEAISVDAEEPETPAEPRILKITRAKSFIGCAVPMVCYVNDKEVCRLKNNQSTEVTVDSRRFKFGVSLSNGMSSTTEHIGEGTAQISLVLKMKTGMIANKIDIERE